MNLTDRLDGLMDLRQIRNKAELARLAGIPYTTIDGIYKRGSDNVTLKTLKSLCNVLGCSIDYLADGIEAEPIEPAIYDLIDAARDNDRDDIRRAADQLRKLKALKQQVARLSGV